MTARPASRTPRASSPGLSSPEHVLVQWRLRRCFSIQAWLPRVLFFYLLFFLLLFFSSLSPPSCPWGCLGTFCRVLITSQASIVGKYICACHFSRASNASPPPHEATCFPVPETPPSNRERRKKKQKLSRRRQAGPTEPTERRSSAEEATQVKKSESHWSCHPSSSF